MTPKTLWRDVLGNVVAAVVVFAFAFLGYTQIMVEVLFGVKPTVDATWATSLSGLASFALGYLVKGVEQKSIEMLSKKLEKPDQPRPDGEKTGD